MGQSAYPEPIVCVINAGDRDRQRRIHALPEKDGSVISYSVNGTTYLFGKTPAGWRVVSFFGHEVGKVIGCNDGV